MKQRWRLWASATFMLGLLFAVTGGGMAAVSASGSTNTDKVTICHAVPVAGTTINHYNQITVSTNSTDLEGHRGHPKDIIPPYTVGGVFHPGQNWTAEGMAIWNNGCVIPTPPHPPVATSTSTTVINAASGAALAGALPNGGSVYDVATVTPTGATGTVNYGFWTNGSCSGTGMSAGSGSHSITEGPLGAGSYSFKARFAATGNFENSVSSCESFTVAAAPPPKIETSVGTVVYDASTNKPLANMTLTAGGSVYDTASVNHSGEGTPTGTIRYRFWMNGSCAGDFIAAGSGAVGATSSRIGPLTAGSYGFRAAYSGDANFEGSTSACEPFTVVNGEGGGPAPTSLDTVVFNAATNAPLTNLTLAAGGKAYDTATINHSGEGTPTGTIRYRFWMNGECTGDFISAGSGAVGSHSSTVGPLQPGTYAFRAAYSGDQNFSASTSACEPFTVVAAGKTETSISTVVFDASTNAALVGGKIAQGGAVYDTASLQHTGEGTPTGTVQYIFWANGTCTGDGESFGLMTVGEDGKVPTSATSVALAAGSFSFAAVYSGDSHFKSSFSSCEPFTVTASTTPTTPPTPPTTTGGVSGGTGGVSSETTTGAPLAETGANPPGFGVGLGLMLLGFVAMFVGAVAWRRQRA